MDKTTEIMFSEKDVGKNLYRKITYYTLAIEQDVLAKDKDEADKLFLDNGGIDHSQINHEITETKNGVENYMVDANYLESGKTNYVGQVAYTDDEFAKEDGDVEINDMKDESPFKDYKENVLKEDSDIDIALNLEAEEQLGK
jgi:hypothetical protein|tara:strand:- start:74 stop:499 length:426 start_codon:yes stop_codon:yes gene_type:complete